MSEMTEQRAREILGKTLVTDDYIGLGDRYYWSSLEPGYLCVNRKFAFSIDELEAIVFWMRANGK